MVPSTLDMVPLTLDKVPSTLDPRLKDTLAGSHVRRKHTKHILRWPTTVTAKAI